jgi:hypothetical protein
MLLEQDYVYTVHSKDRISVRMKREHYNQISEFILTTLKAQIEVTILELIEKANLSFGEKFKGEVAWYIYGVKLDMEARGILKNRRCERRKINYIVRNRNRKQTNSLKDVIGQTNARKK